MQKIITVIYYSDTSLELEAQCQTFDISKNGRVVIPASFKQGKSIIAVCEGNINILNKMGDRVTPFTHASVNDFTAISLLP